LGLFPLAIFDVLELLLDSFEPIGDWYVRGGIFGVSSGLLGIEFGLFEVGNTFKLGAEDIKSRITCYVIDVEVTRMLGDERVGVHHVNCDLVDSMELCSNLI